MFWVKKTSYKNVFFSHKHPLHLFQHDYFYTATHITFWSLSMLLHLKPVPVQLLKSGICEANALTWLQFQASTHLA
jgi:hypothetical protein